MNLRPVYAVLLLSTLAELGGCKALLKKKDPDPAPSATVIASAPAVVIAPIPTPSAVAPAPAPVATVDEATVPASQDFEDEAFTTVTAANFRAQLATLKTAISKP